MGREFLDIFTDWATDYDDFVTGEDEEYKEVFSGYDLILQELVKRSGEFVLELGVGTGNLTRKLLAAGKRVYPIEPSGEMRQLADAKLLGTVDIIDGDMQNFPLPPYKINTILSSYVFHHLNAGEKAEVLYQYYDLLEDGGSVVFADTMFIDQDSYDQKTAEAAHNQFYGLAEDLKREYYPLIPDLYHSFKDAGFRVSFTQMNPYVWIVEGKKESKLN
ncbi:class I SAM-dependent methyltransferase [Desemzia sp. C1]|uniref:class I SAM-dependent DNA methyltransferase n=1 Tax=Desemzia sp. C1 TaxID=2892016 RepID=UPI001E30530D|nr:class I SAM-dependent methyltransferase [Desemzia sp. C1]MCI3028633.1 class I SAM-dependent methyltransferase [Desemzia sp. C1]